MIPPFDLFRTEADGSVKWLGVCVDMDAAKARVAELAAAFHGEYFIESQTTETRLFIKVYGRRPEENALTCPIKDALVNQLIALNNKLNLLSPLLVRSDEERAKVEQQRESLYTDLKRHRSRGHDGKPCPAVRS